MNPHHYDIIRKDHGKFALWLEAASDVDSAESRIRELASFWPGEFRVMDQQTHQIVTQVSSPPIVKSPRVRQNQRA
jgi:hypothetical protein